MKRFYPLAIACLLFLLGCDKEDPAPVQTAEEIVKEEITEALTAEPDLSEFTAVFKDLELEPEELEEGITVFAPANGDPGGRVKTGARVAELTPDVLRNHIVKGLIEALSLEDGDTLKALDGKFLIVSIDGEEIRINGVLVSSKDLSKGENYVIHKVEEIIGEPVEAPEHASVTVTVRNAVKWTPETPAGQPEAGVAVSFYASRTAYVTGNAVFTGETNAEGKITFDEALPGQEYYIVAEKAGMSNIFNRSPEPVDTVYIGFASNGIFQSQADIDEPNRPFQSDAALGNFKWLDANGDGQINNDDRVSLPFEEVTAVVGTPVEIEVFIGYLNNDAMVISDEADALETLQSARNIINSFHKTLVMTDGMLSDDAECGAQVSWCALDNFSFTASDQTVFRIWNDGYKAIGQLNLLVRDLPALTVADKETLIAESRGLRAYVYLQLNNYFGGVPITEGINLEVSDTRATKDEVYDFVTSELGSIVNLLPAGPLDDRSKLTGDAARVLLARVALMQGDFTQAESFAGAVIQGGRYSLSGNIDQIYLSSNNSEIVWDFSFSVTPEFKDYAFGRSISPAIRMGEVYLILAEAKIEQGNPEGRNEMNVIRERRGNMPSESLEIPVLRTELRTTWQTEMQREGDRFINMVRWGLAPEYLAGKNFDQGKHERLPIPQAVIDKNPDILQNPEY